MLVECFGKEIEIVNFSYGSMGKISEYYPFLRFMVRHPHVKNPLDWLRLKREMSELDMIFDVTFGDGFSDIYGKMWNATTDMLKELAIQSGTSLILLPQTYGPYKDPKLKKWAEHIVKKCSFAYSRDTASAVEMNKICGNKVEVLTDMAFALPYNKSEYLVDHSKMNVGINVSSLLWDSAYAKDNKFGLKTEYKEFIMKLIQELLNCGEYRIDYLESPQIDFENHYVHRLAVFDDDLYDLFVQKLGGNDNYKRLHLIDSLNVYLTELIRQPSTEEVFKTMNNLERLDKWIDNQYVRESDGLRKYTYKTAAEKLSELINTMKRKYGIS